MSFPSYHPDVWDALVSAVESDMGTLLPDRCLGQEITYTIPDSDKERTAITCRCKKQSMLVTVYDPSEESEWEMEPVEEEVIEGMIERGGGYARVCAVCDAVGHWPRYDYILED